MNVLELDGLGHVDIAPFIAGGVFDGVLANSVVEYISSMDVLPLVKEWLRIIRPGGFLAVRTVDLDKIIERYTKGLHDYDTSKKFDAYLAARYIFGDKGVPPRKWIYTETTLRALMEAAGFVNFERYIGHENYLELRMAGWKPLE